jgi:hypothetical protein
MIDIDTDEFERGQIGLQNSYGTGYAYNKYGCYFMPPYSCCSWCCFRYDGLCCYPCRGLDKYGINFTGFKLCLWYLLMCKCCHKKKKSTYEREEEMKRNAANGVAAMQMQRARETAIVDAKIEASKTQTTTCCGSCFQKCGSFCHLLFRCILFPVWLPVCILFNICNTCADNCRELQSCLSFRALSQRPPVHPAPPTPKNPPICEKTHKTRYKRPGHIAADVPLHCSDLLEVDQGAAVQPAGHKRGRRKTPPKIQPLKVLDDNGKAMSKPKTDLEHFDALILLKKKEGAWKKKSLQHQRLPPIDDKALASVIRAGRKGSKVNLKAFRL